MKATIGEKDAEHASSDSEETDAHFYDKLDADTVKELAVKAHRSYSEARQSSAWKMHSPAKLKSVLAQRSKALGICTDYDELLKQAAIEEEQVQREDEGCDANFDPDYSSTPYTLTKDSDILKFK